MEGPPKIMSWESAEGGFNPGEVQVHALPPHSPAFYPSPHIFHPYMSFSFFALSFLSISLPSLYCL